MKKLVCLILALFMFPMIAFAEVDLSGMSYDELVALKDKINLAIWNSKEWQEVTVPQGTWEVGKDIPAGSWTVRCAIAYFGMISIGEKLDESGTGIDYHSRIGSEVITSPDYKLYQKGKDVPEYSFTVKDGDYIVIMECDMTFTPYTGKPDLGFK